MSRVVPTRLPTDLARGVDELVRSGRFSNRSEVIKEATRLLLSAGGSSLASKNAAAASRLASLMITWNVKDVEAVTLYGSVARDEATSESDVDLLVVVRDGEPWKLRRSMYGLIYPIIAALGVDISLMVVTRAGWQEMVGMKDPVARGIVEEGKSLWGRLTEQA